MYKITYFISINLAVICVSFGTTVAKPLSLATALRTGLKNHPTMLAADDRLKIRLAESLFTSQIPNPRLEAEFRALTDKPVIELKFMQPIKRSYFGLRQNYAVIESISARADRQAKIAGILNDVYSRYVELWTVQELQAVRNQNREDLLSLRDAVLRSVKAGQSSGVDLAFLDAEIAHEALEGEALDSQRFARSAALAWRLGRTDGKIITVERPSGLPLPKDSRRLKKFAIHRTPLRLALIKREQAARAALAIAHADRRGTMEAGLLAEYDTDRNDLLLGIGFTMNLPVWNRNEAAIARAEAAVGAARNQLLQVEPDRVAALVNLRYRSAVIAERSAQNYRIKVLPLFSDALVKAREGIAKGQAGITQIQPLISRIGETRLRSFALQTAALEARANLEAALGGRLEEALSASIKK